MSDAPRAMIYGANGYTGRLIARRAVSQGLRPTLAGRNHEAVAALAKELDLPSTSFSLHQPAQIAECVKGYAAVLHCAGPFSQTASPMMDACIATGADYLDITGEIAGLMPKPVTSFDPHVNLRIDMSREEVSEYYIPPHFTNIQHSLQLSRRFLATQDTPNRQIILITDGLPTAHFEGSVLRLIYPAHPSTEQATMREGMLCHREGITINIFLLPSWSQSSEDVQFAYRLAE